VNRRDFITLLGGAAAAWPLAARAQQPSDLPRIGSIHTTRSENSEAFFQALRDGGYVEGQNVLLESRFSEGEVEPVDGFARELVALKCSVYTVRTVGRARRRRCLCRRGRLDVVIFTAVMSCLLMSMYDTTWRSSASCQ
jgi:hypothetical protein